MAFIEPISQTLARIKVVGVGGAGQNAVTSMIDHKRIQGVEFISMNTDLQALNSSSSQVRVQLGPDRTHGLGSGADPQVGLEAAQESIDEIQTHLQGADMIFIAAGLGGGTGTGACPIVAQVARELGCLTVGIVTKPFEFEGKRRMNQAEQGIAALREKVDALIVIPDQKLLEIVDDTVPLQDAFMLADEVIGSAVEGISELITSTGLVNVDFADVKAIMTNAGSALMGVGYADGENRAEKAAEAAINSPLLDVDITGSTGVLINIIGDQSMTMHEVNTAAQIISNAAHDGANIIFGANVDPAIDGIKVTVIATGFDADFASFGLPEVSDTVSGEDVLNQIDARFDDDDTKDIMVSEEDFDATNNFDIEEMRKQVQQYEEEVEVTEEEKAPPVDDSADDPTDDSGDDKDEEEKSKARTNFWNFIREGRS